MSIWPEKFSALNYWIIGGAYQIVLGGISFVLQSPQVEAPTMLGVLIMSTLMGIGLLLHSKVVFWFQFLTYPILLFVMSYLFLFSTTGRSVSSVMFFILYSIQYVFILQLWNLRKKAMKMRSKMANHAYSEMSKKLIAINYVLQFLLASQLLLGIISIVQIIFALLFYMGTEQILVIIAVVIMYISVVLIPSFFVFYKIYRQKLFTAYRTLQVVSLIEIIFVVILPLIRQMLTTGYQPSFRVGLTWAIITSIHLGLATLGLRVLRMEKPSGTIMPTNQTITTTIFPHGLR